MSLHGAGAVITTLDQFNFSTFGGDAAWLESGGTTYLVVGGASVDVEIFTFDGSTLTTTGITLSLVGATRAVAWLQSGGNDYLAVGAGDSLSGLLNIYIFDGLSLTLVDSIIFGAIQGEVHDVEWLTAANGSIFLAAAILVNGTDEISVYSFDGFSLTFLDGADYTQGGYGVGWLQAASPPKVLKLN
ncbi:unnamed protein product [marine sediment metagenome]|uniref:Uncharacterized protein n=1 Tax=marine sediment metagenome TaxID=412755 RepID=X1BWQ9_9ZZZZ